MPYTDITMKYCLDPKNCRSMDSQDPYVGVGQVGSLICGDVIKVFLRIENDQILDASFQVFGCGSAIAASAFGVELLSGKNVHEAQAEVTNDILFHTLGLPPIKRHCSVLFEEGLEAAILDYNSEAKMHMRSLVVL